MPVLVAEALSVTGQATTIHRSDRQRSFMAGTVIFMTTFLYCDGIRKLQKTNQRLHETIAILFLGPHLKGFCSGSMNVCTRQTDM
jgi:hypothetical protein